MKRICFAALSLALLSGAAAQFSAVPLPSAEGKTKYPLVLKTPFGTTTLKTGPRRVAVVGSIHDLEAALALGVTPVVSTARAWPWHDENGAKKIALRLEEGEDGQPFEKIAAAKPDVILAATDYDLANNYKRLSQIAPVAALTSYEGEPSDADWKDVIRLHGRVFDLAGRAENRIAEFDRNIAALAARHPEYKGKTVSMLLNYGPKWGLVLLNHKGSATEQLLSRLGFKPHPNAGVTDEDGGVKPEQFGRLNADAIVLAEFGTRPGEKVNSHEWLRQFPLFTSLPAMKQGKVVRIAPTADNSLPIAWSLRSPNILSMNWTLRLLEDKLRVFRK